MVVVVVMTGPVFDCSTDGAFAGNILLACWDGVNRPTTLHQLL
jgi:hypothetical protein